MTSSTVMDLFGAPPLPIEKVWYAVQLLHWEVVKSPTRGQMFRLRGDIIQGVCAGTPCWKPLTDDLKGIAWCERSLRALGVKAYRLARLREQYGVGRYLVGLLDELIAAGRIRATVYPFQHPTEGLFWTIRGVKPRA